MLKNIAIALTLTASLSYAQEAPVNSFGFVSKQTCGVYKDLAKEVGSYGEEILFTGKAYQDHMTAGPVWVDFVFTVNQDTGTWSLVSFLDDTYACYVASGINFEVWSK